MATNPTPGITPQATRPIRRQTREQAASLGSIIDPDQAAAAPEKPASPSRPPKTATGAKSRRLAATEAKKPLKQPLTTRIETTTGKRLDYLLQNNPAFKVTDVVGDALDALMDELDVPQADELP